MTQRSQRAWCSFLELLATCLLLPCSILHADQAFVESGGQVVMQAENYDNKIARGGHDWTLETSKSGFSGNGYMIANPNTGASNNTNYTIESPELVFNVQFATTGTYYVWIRGQGDSGNDDSIHAGLDSTVPASADRMDGYNNASWVWKYQTLDGVPSTLVIPTPGLHTVHLWMREDGMRADKMLLRTSSSSTAPSGTGPAESARVNLDTTPPQVTITSPADGSVVTP